MRAAFVRLHRWVGLAMAAFLIIAGLTGSVIAFNHELDEWLNPELFTTDSRGAAIPSMELARRIQAAEPRRYVAYVPLDVEPGHSLVLGLRTKPDPATGQSTDTRYYEVFVDPITGARLGERTWGACCLGRQQLVPFLYSIHYSLHLPEVWGMRIMGAVAIAWMMDCFVGFYLTLPGKRRRAWNDDVRGVGQNRERGSFLARWKPAWQIKTGTNPYRLNFDMHRAIGLWVWILFFTLAVSGVYLALRYEVFRPALRLVTAITPDPFEQGPSSPPLSPRDTSVSYPAIVATAHEEARRRGWQAPYDVFHSPEFGLYGVGFGDHHAPGIGVPYLYFDARTGRVRNEVVPGQGTPGDVFMQWLLPLHSGQIVGLPGRILVSLSGVAVVVLTVTGIVIWTKKRRGRRALAVRAREQEAA